jgi:hypothetical protein
MEGAPDGGSATSFAPECIMHFTVGVPTTSFYQFTIAGHGGVTKTLAQMRRNDWRVRFELSR